jgi:hypothetical protein
LKDEINQLNLTFEKEAANAKWDPRVKKGWWNGKISYFKYLHTST